MSAAELATRLHEVDWLASASSKTLTRLVGQSTLLALAEGEVLYGSEEPADRLFVLIEGRVGAWRARHGDQPDDGDGIWYFICDAPLTTLCLENVITDIPYFATMRVLSETASVLAVPGSALTDIVDAERGIGLEIARHIARRLQGFTEQATDIALLDTSRRLAKYLTRLVDDEDRTTPMTQTELAARLGTSRQSVNTALARFAHRGWIVNAGHGSYRVLDPGALRLHAGALPPSGAEIFR